MARALAHGTTPLEKFDDPTAMVLLPEPWRARVQLARGGKPHGIRQRVGWSFFRRSSAMLVVRTVAIDEAVRAAASPQLVILGAGLDGRAWRMKELRDATVFEVDHPASQRDKRARVATLTQAAREVHFVPVDFQRDSLDDALAKAGHNAALPTTWIWEGVVMYLSPADVEATLAVIARRSAPLSRVVITYPGPGIRPRLLGFFVAKLGEPIRSAFSEEAMRALLSRHDFRIVHDDDLPSLATSMSFDIGRGKRLLKHYRIVVAEHSP
jgi:methyltransferase (TIGR00027 family)